MLYFYLRMFLAALLFLQMTNVTKKIYFFNSTSAPNIIWFDLNKLNFLENAPILSMNPVDVHLEGDVTNKLLRK